ncbi:MAG: helix-turn-helix domain-containing protein [Bdellovibrionales bacterium]
MPQSIYSQTYYEILEIEPSAPQDEIHRAYQRAKQTYSGGSPALYSMFSADETKELLKLIEEAYTVLSNQESRSRYDRQISNSSSLRVQPHQLGTHTSTNAYSTPAKYHDQMLAEPRKPATTNPVPEGFAKTRFGVYEINPLLEEEIEECQEFSGEFLKKIRIYKKVSLEDLSEYIRVSKAYINAVEMEDYDGLPAPVFIRGFVSQIAKALNLSEPLVAKTYMQRYKSARP